MDGILSILKIPGVSSAQALYRVRDLTGQRKSGHAGALDPPADGVLLVCLGTATKLVERLMDQPKVYRTLARLDVTSETHDADRPLTPVVVAAPPTAAQVRAACDALEGEIEQSPPTISAVKIRGKPAYHHVRKGRTPDLPPRCVRVYWIVMQRYAWPEIELELACGRGMYVRSLLRDLGAALGAGGCLMTLTRTAVGPFTLDNSISLRDLTPQRIADALLPTDAARELLSHPAAIPPRPAC